MAPAATVTARSANILRAAFACRPLVDVPGRPGRAVARAGRAPGAARGRVPGAPGLGAGRVGRAVGGAAARPAGGAPARAAGAFAARAGAAPPAGKFSVTYAAIRLSWSDIDRMAARISAASRSGGLTL